MPSDRLRITILGCGSSGGVPRVGGDWGHCDPDNPRNRRRRCSLLVQRLDRLGRTTAVLVDAGPDLRSQLLDAQVQDLDAVLLTHDHADHIHGLDDLRGLYLRNEFKPIPVYANGPTAITVGNRFAYAFRQLEGSPYRPFLELRNLPNTVGIRGSGGTLTAQSYPVPHGSVEALGFRFGPVGYTPDLSDMSEDAWRVLQGIDLWIVDALQATPHPTHAHLPLTLSWISALRPERAVLTNMHYWLDYDETARIVPQGVQPAHDMLSFEFKI